MNTICQFCFTDAEVVSESGLCLICQRTANGMHAQPNNYAPQDIIEMAAENYRTNLVLNRLVQIQLELRSLNENLGKDKRSS